VEYNLGLKKTIEVDLNFFKEFEEPLGKKRRMNPRLVITCQSAASPSDIEQTDSGFVSRRDKRREGPTAKEFYSVANKFRRAEEQAMFEKEEVTARVEVIDILPGVPPKIVTPNA